MYSVEIKVERDKLTGETRVLSANTTLPVDRCHQGVKVYEDEQKGTTPVKGTAYSFVLQLQIYCY